MPCMGPTPAESLEMEISENERRYGIRGTDLDIATRVACHLAKGESNKLTKAWIKEHERLDKERKEAEDRFHREVLAKAEIDRATADIRRKHGLK